MELKLGKMTGHELAKWFNISYNTYSKNAETRHNYLNKLHEYCDFDEIYGGVIIKTIYIAKYSKNLKLKTIKIYLENLKQHDNIVSMSGMEAETGISCYCLTQVRDDLFGSMPTTNTKQCVSGKIGFRELVWAIKLEGPNNYRELTPREEELFDSLIDQNYIGKLTPKVVKEQQLILDYCAKEGKTVQEYQEILATRNCNFFDDVIQKFKTITGHQLVRATKHHIGSEWTWCEFDYKDIVKNLIL